MNTPEKSSNVVISPAHQAMARRMRGVRFARMRSRQAMEMFAGRVARPPVSPLAFQPQ